MSFTSRLTFIKILFFPGLALVLLVFFSRNLLTNYYQCDEFSYLAKSRYFELYRKGDFSNPAWQENDAVDQVKLMEYIYGLPSLLLYGKSFKQVAVEESSANRNYYNYSFWSKWYGKTLKLLELTPRLRMIVFFSRTISSLFTVCYIFLAVFLIFFIFRSYFLAFFSFIFLISHPVINIHGRQILADSALNFFLLLSFLGGLVFWRNFWLRKSKRLFLPVILAGLAAGLAASTKINGFMAVIFFVFVMLIAGFLTAGLEKKQIKKRRLKKIIFSLYIFLFLSFSIFYLLHPTIWKNPAAGVKRFVDWRVYITEFYQQTFPHESVTSFLKAFYLLFSRVPGYLAEVGSIGFIYVNEFGKQNFLPYFIINLTLFLLGIVLFFLNLTKKRNFYKSLEFISAIWSLVTIIVVAFYLKLDWTRYYWPCFLPFLIIDSMGLKLIFSTIKKKIC
ncbi:MAG TPA: phospholipid carrier-dependent glycosyltransferase [Candidatus Bathyarchaeia archaeon]|nr:phospholipid carrier-dependent glycosyltransferase [Candidatus Bathyarchaeia archaeon]